MNDKNRFLGIFHHKRVNRIPDCEFCFWTETIDRWHTEGSSLEGENQQGRKIYFGFDVVERAGGFLPFENLPVRIDLYPALPNMIIEQKD